MNFFDSYFQWTDFISNENAGNAMTTGSMIDRSSLKSNQSIDAKHSQLNLLIPFLLQHIDMFRHLHNLSAQLWGQLPGSIERSANLCFVYSISFYSN